MEVLILTSHRKGFASLCIPRLIENGIRVKAVILNTNEEIDKKKFKKRKWEKIKKIGILGALNGIRMRTWYKDDVNRLMQPEDIELVTHQHHIPFDKVPKINSPLTRELFRKAEADIGISMGNGYIGSKVFTIPKFGMLNIHHEILPDYQGAQSIIWPIFHQQNLTGYTIHQIDKKIDNGKILYQESFEIQFFSSLRETVSKNYFKSKEKSIHGLIKVLKNFDHFFSKASLQEGSKYYTTPTFRQFLQIWRNHNNFFKNS